jgi:flagella basal body P-ring formation protein FlgA
LVSFFWHWLLKGGLPVFRQVFAAVICRYVGIASPPFVAHTRPMHNFIALIFTLLMASVAQGQTEQTLPINKQRLIDQAQGWVSQQTAVAPEQIEIAAIDRRLLVPDCGGDFIFSFPYASSQQTIKVECPDTGWQIFVGVSLHRSSKGFVFKQDMQVNQTVTAAEVTEKTFDRPVKGVVTSVEELNNQSLVRGVEAGDLVLKRYLADTVLVYQLKRDILQGEAIRSEDITKLSMSQPRTAVDQRFPMRLISQSVAAQDLWAGAIISRRDLSVKHMVMMAKTIVTRGQRLSPQNTELKAYYGKLPSDALLEAADLNQMEAIHTVRAGQLLRSSDVRLMSMVNKGDTVVLNVGSGLLNISTTMIALENGKLDQQISLLNPESNETVRAVVSGPGEARGL